MARKRNRNQIQEDDDFVTNDEEPVAKKQRKSTRIKDKNEKEEQQKKDEIDLKFWEKHESVLVYNHPDAKPSEKIAAFDYDWTLAKPKSGKKFPSGGKDFALLFPSSVKTLQKLHKDGFKLVIFSNQAGIEKGKQTEEEVEERLQRFVESINVPFQIFVTTIRDHFRKPSPELWELMRLHYNGDQKKIDKEVSFYVGDAAGRPKGWKPKAKKDFNASDRKFAFNIGVNFYTPEEFFLEEKPAPYTIDGIDPSTIPLDGELHDGKTPIASDEQEMIIFVAAPASGKSTVVKQHLEPKGYVHINRDTLKTQKKCLSAAKDALSKGQSVVVDNTNPDRKSRAPYIALAQDVHVPVRCFRFNVPLEIAHHLNLFRERITRGERRRVPDVGFNMFKKKLEEPKLNEGFSEIKSIGFSASFEDEETKAKFLQYT